MVEVETNQKMMSDDEKQVRTVDHKIQGQVVEVETNQMTKNDDGWLKIRNSITAENRRKTCL